MNRAGVEYLGWGATAVFVGSYFCPQPLLLRAVQILGASLWVIYGVLIEAWPVIVANILVVSAAAWTTFRKQRNSGANPPCRIDTADG
jgi:hypothetical protein